MRHVGGVCYQSDARYVCYTVHSLVMEVQKGVKRGKGQRVFVYVISISIFTSCTGVHVSVLALLKEILHRQNGGIEVRLRGTIPLLILA